MKRIIIAAAALAAGTTGLMASTTDTKKEGLTDEQISLKQKAVQERVDSLKLHKNKDMTEICYELEAKKAMTAVS